jgi:P-type Cu+ transporter
MSTSAVFPIESGSRHETELTIEGMTCASCVARVERALKAVPGVAEASVNLMTETATVSAADSVPFESLHRAVVNAGYEARELKPQYSRASSSINAPKAPPNLGFNQIIAAAALSLPLVLPMLLAPFGIDAMLPGWIQFVLATIVQFVFGVAAIWIC